MVSKHFLRSSSLAPAQFLLRVSLDALFYDHPLCVPTDNAHHISRFYPTRPTQTFRCIAPRLTRSREGRPSLELHLISADLVLFSCFFLLQRISSRSVPPRRRRRRSSAQHSATPSGFTSFFFYFSNSDPPPIWTLSQAVVSLHDSKNKKKIATQLWKKSNQQTHSQQQHSFR